MSEEIEEEIEIEIEIELDDDLLGKTRRVAEETGRTVEQVIRDAIMAGIEKEEDDSSEEAEAAASIPSSLAGTADRGSSSRRIADTEGSQLPGLPPGAEEMGPGSGK